MLKTLSLIAAVGCAILIPTLCPGQSGALPTATANGQLQVGAGASYSNPDYSQANIKGASAFVDFDFSPHVGLEANLHYVSLFTPDDVGENTYSIGPRAKFNYGRFQPYARLGIGIGSIVIQEQQDNVGRQSANYLMYNFAAGVDVTVSTHIFVRAIDFEYQRWPNLGNGLSPYVATIGAGYRFR